jgi:MSHA biogenesis protein MshQ
MKMNFSLVAVVMIGAGLLLTCSKDNNSGTNPKMEPSVPEQGLLANYPFNSSADDATGNNNDGALMGGATVTGSGYLTIGPNASDALSLPRRVLDGLADFTASAWLRMGRTGNSYDNFWLSCSDGTNHNFVMMYYDNSDNRWEIAIDAATYAFTTDIQMKDLKWHHVAVMRSGALARLFIDGTEVGTGISVKTSTLAVTNNGLILGQDQDAVGGSFQEVQSWAGDMDNLRFYDRALSEAEVGQLAAETHSGN